MMRKYHAGFGREGACFLPEAIWAWQRTLTSEEVVTGERYGTIELLEYDAAARRFVPVITSPVAVTGDPRTVQDTVDSFWIKHRQKFKPDYNPVSEKCFERNPRDPYE